MDSTLIHVCLDTMTAPSPDDELEVGQRWACACGDTFVYREGFTRGGHASLEWWPAPAIPAPRSEWSVRSLLFGPRKG